MAIISNAPPPPPSASPPPGAADAKIRPSGWWYLPAILLLVGGVVGGIAVVVGGFVNLSGLVDDFARIEVREGAATQDLRFDDDGRFVLYYEFESDIDGEGFAGADSTLPAVLTATVTGPQPGGAPLLVREARDDFSFSFSGTAGIAFASVRIPEPGTYTVAVESSETQAFVVSVGPSVFGQLRTYLLVGFAVFVIGVVLGIIWIVVLAVKRGRRKRERDQARAMAARAMAARPPSPYGPAPGWNPVPAPAPPSWPPSGPPAWPPAPAPPAPPPPGWGNPPAPGWGNPPPPGDGPLPPPPPPTAPSGRWVQPGQD
jgi:hypothetical protein